MKHRDFDDEQKFYASWTDAIQEFIGTLVSNFRLQITSTTSISFPASAGSGQVSVGLAGRFRYLTTAYVLGGFTGTAGIRDVFVVCTSENDFTGAGNDPDSTVYAFELRQVAHDATPGSVTAYRKVAEVDWDGSKIVGLRQLVGAGDQTLPAYPTAPNSDSPAMVAYTYNGLEALKVGPTGDITTIAGKIPVAALAVGGLTDTWIAVAAGIDMTKINGLVAALAGKAASAHNHAQSNITGLAASLAAKQDASTAATDAELAAGLATKANSSHSHAQSNITNLVSDLAGKAASSHSHAQSDVTGLAASLAAKSDTGHSHNFSALTGQAASGQLNLTTAYDALGSDVMIGTGMTNIKALSLSAGIWLVFAGVSMQCISADGTLLLFNGASYVQSHPINAQYVGITAIAYSFAYIASLGSTTSLALKATKASGTVVAKAGAHMTAVKIG